MTNQNYETKEEEYVFKYGFLFSEKDWIRLKNELIVYTSMVLEAEKNND